MLVLFCLVTILSEPANSLKPISPNMHQHYLRTLAQAKFLKPEHDGLDYDGLPLNFCRSLETTFDEMDRIECVQEIFRSMSNDKLSPTAGSEFRELFLTKAHKCGGF